MWTIIVSTLIVFTIIVIIFTTKGLRKQGKKLGDLIESIDIKYDDFIQARINFSILKTKDFQFDKDNITKEVMTVLKPEISGLISFINASTYSNVKINYDSLYFRNIASLSRELFRRKDENANHFLNDVNEKELFEAFKDAIKSDLTNRLLTLKTESL